MSIIQIEPNPWSAPDGTIDLSRPGVVRPFTGAAPPEVIVIVAGTGRFERETTPLGSVGFGPLAARLQAEPKGDFLLRYAEHAAKAIGVESAALVVRDLGVPGCAMPDGKLHATYHNMMWAPYGFAAEPWPGCYATIARIARSIPFGVWFGSVDRVNHATLASPDIRWLSAPGSVDRVARAIADLSALGINLFGLDNLSGADALLDEPPGAHWASGVEHPPVYPTDAPGTSMTTPPRSPGIVDALIAALDEAAPGASLIAESLLAPGRAIFTRCAGLRMLSSAAAPLAGRPGVTRDADVRALLSDAWTRSVLNPGVPIISLVTGDGWTAGEVRHALGLIRDMPGRASIALDWWALKQALGVDPHE